MERSGWFRAFQDFTQGFEGKELTIEGKIPENLHGTLYRMGVGQYTALNHPLPHWFDGDGAIVAFRIKNGQVHATAKPLKTFDAQRETKAGQHFLGSYGFPPASLYRRLTSDYRNAANTAVLAWNERLFALWEGGLPTEVSPQDLSTIGETSLDQVIQKAFSAHPHYVPSRKAYYNFGVQFTPVFKLHLYELKENHPARRIATFPFRGSTMAHDFMATDNYLIVMAPPVFVDPISMFFKAKSLAESMFWKPSAGTQIFIIPIDQPESYWKTTVDAFLPSHFFNGFEKDGKILVDATCFPDFTLADRINSLSKGIVAPMTPGKVIRWEIDLKAKKINSHTLSDTFCETPQVSPLAINQEYSQGYAIGYSSQKAFQTQYFDVLTLLDIRTGKTENLSFGAGHYPSEPVFVPRIHPKSMDDGHLLSLVYDSHRHESYLAIIDSTRFGAGAVARAYLHSFFPLTFHGTWT